MDTVFALIWFASMIYFFVCLFTKKRRKGKKKWITLAVSLLSLVIFAALTPDTSEKADKGQLEKTEKVAVKSKKSKVKSDKKKNQAKLLAIKESKKKESAKQESLKKEQESKEASSKKAAEQASQAKLAAAKKSSASLANLEYQGTQTINVNNGVPTFSNADMSTANGAWEKYGNLDGLNRATSAEAMLNQSTMPKDGEERSSISEVTPTGWKNKRIGGGYLFNRSHLIGWALSDENANWKNLITGTRSLNSPEMLRFEMDTKTYLEQSSSNYVRYSVTPVFRSNELLARGVHMMAKSVGSNAISFNVYIFNVQSGVKLNYADGSSNVSGATTTASTSQGSSSRSSYSNSAQSQPAKQSSQSTAQAGANDNMTVYVTPTGSKYHTHPHGRGHFTPTTLKEAKAAGLTPCNVCNPPS
ncbi:hypothetical protein LFYK43_11190 [Ligilactobacillus salitolerans]|uniref:Type VII secretion system protein EssD-like domain-containing protein n=1 Tax=Ligilactobacillus salitolerans TaxID=1808352 RepID=A0A401ISZ1_9LACO|nr:DNA/RNA non-specific endonuclease [Ligilactobacillus salitolerans]GBG94660.1 hypothetical protein LFYK43_11190 [Ligilactobacillus salitolerans]